MRLAWHLSDAFMIVPRDRTIKSSPMHHGLESLQSDLNLSLARADSRIVPLFAASVYHFLSLVRAHMKDRIGVCLFVLFAAICGVRTAFAQSEPVSIFRQAIEARNRGDLDGMMQYFAPDAVREDGSCSPPCVGIAAVRRSFEKNIAEHFQASLTSVEGSGDTVTGRAEIRSDAFRAQGVDHRMTSYTVKFRDGKIVRWSSPLPGAQVAVPPKK
jgi:ketosteroid isomerase-like protein